MVKPIYSQRSAAFENAVHEYVASLFSEQRFANALATSFKPVYKLNKDDFMKKAIAMENNLKDEVTQQLNAEINKQGVLTKLAELDHLEEQCNNDKVVLKISDNLDADVEASIFAKKVKYHAEQEEIINAEYDTLKNELQMKLEKCKSDMSKLQSRLYFQKDVVNEYQTRLQDFKNILSNIDMSD